METGLNERTLVIRQRCLDRKKKISRLDQDPLIVMQSLESSLHIDSWQICRGEITAAVLRDIVFEIDDLELLAGRLAPDRVERRSDRESAAEFLGIHYPYVFTPGQAGHCQLDFSRLFNLGIDGLRSDLQIRQDRTTGDQADVYQSFILALNGFSDMIVNAAAAAEAALPSASLERKVELERIAADCRFIAHRPPITFRQALQLAWLSILACQVGDRAWLVVPGHLDRYLAPYYDADVDKGILDRPEALLLIESLYLLVNETVADGLAVSVMVGGRDSAGNDLTHPLSYLCLEALRRTRLVYPTVGVCWHTGTPQDLTDLAMDLITSGCANPAFFGDETIQRGLQMYGVPESESWDYINSTCVEITPVGSSNVWVASPYFSVCQTLLDEITDQVDRGTVPETFTDFMAGYRLRLSQQIGEAVDVENASRQSRQSYGGKPLQSIFTRDCIERGRDIDDGGARYNWIECSFVGLANLADSLHVLEQEVYIRKRLTLPELHHILVENFAGYEIQRLRFLNEYPKYGNNIPQVDRLVAEIVQFVRTECARYTVFPDSAPFVPGAFCWVMHEHLGSQCGATPDGRLAGFPFADGCGGAQGREQAGPTAAALSVTSWDAAPLIGGAAFNMKFNAGLFENPASVRRLRDVVTTFMQLGGFETQINVLDAQVLKDAQMRPEMYRDLVVRIGGYTDYFTRLTPQMQAEVILRTEYGEI